MLIDPKTRKVLGRFSRKDDCDEDVSVWNYNPPARLPDSIIQSVQKAIVQVADALRSGFENPRSENLQAILMPSEIFIHPAAPDAGTTKPPETNEKKLK